MRKICGYLAMIVLAATPLALRAEDTADKKSTTPPVAQQPGRGGPGGQGGGNFVKMFLDRTHALVNELKLTDDQKTKVDDIFKDTEVKAKDLAAKAQDIEPQERREKFQEITKDLHDKVVAVLDDDQKKEFEDKVTKAREQMQKRFQNRQVPGGPQGAPGAAGQRGPGANAAGMLDRVQGAIKQLDLSDEQKSQIKGLMEDSAAKFKELRDQGATGDDLRTKAREVFTETQQQLRSILTPEQQAKLRELMMQQQPPKADVQNKATEKEKADKKDETKKEGEKPAASASPGPDPGKIANLDVKKLDGRTVRLSSFKGRVVTLVFGSYSTPTFRDKAAALDQLAQQYSARSVFMVIYTKEAHPAGGWDVERNKQQKIEIPQHKTEADRLAQAKQARDTLHLNHVIIGVDSMDDGMAKLFDVMPNGAVVIGRDGKIAGTQKWVEVEGLKHLIEQAAGN